MGQSIQRSSNPNVCSSCFGTSRQGIHTVAVCEHCSRRFCAHCMREHVDQLPYSISQLAQDNNSLKQLFREKQDMVRQEAVKSTDEAIQSLKNYQSALTDALQMLIANIQSVQQGAEVIHRLIQFSSNFQIFLGTSEYN